MFSLTYDNTIGFAQLLYNTGVDKSALSSDVIEKFKLSFIKLVSTFENMANPGEGLVDITIYLNGFIALLGVALPIAVLLDLLLDKNRKAHPKDKKTDWFYKNEKFDRKLDERADKNNYRTL